MKTMKKGLSILMSVLMVLSMFSGLLVTSFAAAPVIVMTMDTDKPAVGDTITITASCENMVGTQTGEIDFVFDPEYLSYVSWRSAGGGFTCAGMKLDADSIFDFVFVYSSPAECDTDLCAITFKVLKPGETSITARVRIDSWAGVEAPADSALSLTAQPEAERDVLTYGIYEGEAIVEDCDESAAGELVIPDTYQGYPVTGIASDAFYNCGALTSVTIPDSVTEIKGNAFAYCSGLTDITLPENLTEIGYDAFYKCSSLKTVTVPDGVTNIADGVFYECTSLETVELPDSVTTIGSNTFAFCSSLKNVTIPDSVTEIGWQAFYKCVSLPEIAVPDGVTAIGGSLFYGCSNLTTISLPDSIESIGAFAFLNTAYYKDASHWENDALYISDYLLEAKTTIRGDYTIKDGTGIIADNAFRNCADLTGVSIPDSVKSIGSAAFASCSSMPAVEIPNSVTEIGADAFSACSALASAKLPKNLTAISRGLFYNCSNLTTIDLPQNTEIIGDSAFMGCSALPSVELSDSVKTIGYGAFADCSSIKSMDIPAGVTEIGYRAFFDCSGITAFMVDDANERYYSDANGVLFDTNYNDDGTLALLYYPARSTASSYAIPDGVQELFSYSFRNASSLTSLAIPASVTSGVWGSSFEGCSSMTAVSVDRNNERYFTDEKGVLFEEKIDSWDDSRTVNLLYYPTGKTDTSYRVPDDVACIDSDAFADCRSLTRVDLPDSLEEINSDAFQNCTGLQSMQLPANVRYVYADAFTGCSSMTSVTVDKNNEKYFSDENGVLFAQEKNYWDDSTTVDLICYPAGKTDRTYTIPDSVTEISSYAFSGCTSLLQIVISDGVTYIGWNAFENCTGLRRVELPTSVTMISEAFTGCTSLTDVYYAGSESDWNEIEFYGNDECLNAATIHYNSKMPDEPIEEEPTTEPTTKDPVTEPTTKDPVTEPTTKDPGTEPTTKDPGTEPSTKDPGTEPSTKDPGTEPSTKAPEITTEPTTKAPTTIAPTTEEPTTQSAAELIVKDTDSGIAVSEGEKLASIDAVENKGLSVEAIKAKLGNDSVAIVNKDGEVLADDALVGTGCVIQVLSENGEVLSSYTVLVPMDVNGDASITAQDARSALRAAAQLEKPEGVYRNAADTDGDTKLTASDARRILRKAAHLE